MTFVLRVGTFCFEVGPFDLIRAWSVFQRMVDYFLLGSPICNALSCIIWTM